MAATTLRARPFRLRKRQFFLLLTILLAGTVGAVSAADQANDKLTPRQSELATAVRGNNLDAIHTLLDEGVETPAIVIVQAVNKAKIETIEALVQGGADVNAVLDLGGIQATPLGSAVTANRPDVVDLLLSAGAKTETPHLARTPLDWAREKRLTEIVAALLAQMPDEARPAGLDALLQAINAREYAEIQKILESGQDPNEKDDQGSAPIHHAAQNHDSEALRLLLGAGANPDLRDAAGNHAVELAPGLDSVSRVLLEASPELLMNRAVPPSRPDKVYRAGATIGGPCQHSGRIPRDAGCGASGTEIFIGTRVSTTGWSDAVGPPLCEPVTLPPLPGEYTVTVMSTASEWSGDNCYESIGKVYFSKKNTSTTSTHSFTVKKCKPGEERMADSKDYDPIEQEGFAGQVQQAFVKALRRHGIDAGPEHVRIEDVDATSQFFTFFLRVSHDGCLLPQEEAIARECIRDYSQEGAMYMLVGGIQRTGTQTRATPRIVRIGTGEIGSTGKADVNGNSAEAAGRAFEKGLDSMDYKITCTKDVVR